MSVFHIHGSTPDCVLDTAEKKRPMILHSTSLWFILNHMSIASQAVFFFLSLGKRGDLHTVDLYLKHISLVGVTKMLYVV